jgi:hypothetical protein
MRSVVPEVAWVKVEEWAAQMMENHSLEAVQAASEALGRPICVKGLCNG